MNIFKRKDEEPKESEIEIDPIAMARETINKMLECENLYFELLTKVGDGSKKNRGYI